MRDRATGGEAECENGGVCVNTHGSFYCNCTAGFVGQRCGLRPVVVPDMQAGHAVLGKEELIGIAVVLFVIVTLIILFIAFRKKVFVLCCLLIIVCFYFYDEMCKLYQIIQPSLLLQM